jgi:hypothetical protein
MSFVKVGCLPIDLYSNSQGTIVRSYNSATVTTKRIPDGKTRAKEWRGIDSPKESENCAFYNRKGYEEVVNGEYKFTVDANGMGTLVKGKSDDSQKGLSAKTRVDDGGVAAPTGRIDRFTTGGGWDEKSVLKRREEASLGRRILAGVFKGKSTGSKKSDASNEHENVSDRYGKGSEGESDIESDDDEDDDGDKTPQASNSHEEAISQHIISDVDIAARESVINPM